MWQFMCVTVSNITIVAQQKNNKLVHTTINNVTLDGSILPRSQIALCGSIDVLSCRLLQTAANSERYFCLVLLELFKHNAITLQLDMMIFTGKWNRIQKCGSRGLASFLLTSRPKFTWILLNPSFR